MLNADPVLIEILDGRSWHAEWGWSKSRRTLQLSRNS